MMKKTNYSSKFKADRVLEVLREEETLGEIAFRYGINPNLLHNWKRNFLEKAPLLFDESNQNRILVAKEREMESKREELLKTVSRLTIERDWLKKNQSKYLALTMKRDLVGVNPDITIRRQCELLGLNEFFTG